MRTRVPVALALAFALLIPSGARTAAAADAPNTCSGVTAASAKNIWLTDEITNASDVDWFRFALASPKRVLVTLGQLPANYRLDLYSDCATKLASSNRSGRQFEEILRKLPAGTYHVKASSAAGASSGSNYRLKFRPLASGVILLSTKAWTIEGGTKLVVVGELFNNTADTRQFAKIEIRFFDGANQQLGPTYIGYSHIALMEPRTRSPVGGGYAPIPAGYDHYSLRAGQGSPTSEQPVGDLVVNAGAPWTTDWGARHYPGTLTNSNAFALTSSQVVLTLYDKLGKVVNVDFTYPGAVPAGGTVEFDCILFDHFDGVNRYAFAGEGER